MFVGQIFENGLFCIRKIMQDGCYKGVEVIMISLNLRKIIKNPIIIGVTAFIFLWITLFVYMDSSMKLDTSPELELINIVKIIPILFFSFMVISYIIFNENKKCRIEECILVNKMGLIRENLSKAAIILAIDFLSAVYILVGTMRYYRMKNIVDYDFYLYTFKVIAVYVFLLLIVAMFLGMLAAQASKRLTGICLLIMFYFVFSDTFMQFILSLFSDNESVSNYLLIFGLFYRCAGMIIDRNYFLTMENINIYRMLFWILVCLTIIAVRKFRIKIYSVIYVFLTLSLFILSVRSCGASYNLFGFYIIDSWHHDSIYYSDFQSNYVEKNKELIKSVKKSKTDFKVLSYDMDYKVSDVLDGKVIVIPDNKSKKSYKFTLYHGYNIKNITNEKGEKLDYVRKGGDYIEIYNPAGKIEKIKFEYSGFSRFFYSTTQALKLPGGFVYYPIPGWHIIYDGEEQMTEKNYLENKAKFNVKISLKGNYRVISNLNEYKSIGKTQYFKGNSTTLTILGSPYLIEKEYKGVHIVYSRLDRAQDPKYNKEDFKIVLKGLKKYKNKNIKLFLIDNGGESYKYANEDSIYGNLISVADYLETGKMY